MSPGRLAEPVRAEVPSSDFEALFAAPAGAPAVTWLVEEDGRRTALPVARWHGPAEPALLGVARRCAGPSVDIGCGPGRLTAAIAALGTAALGVDSSPTAVRLTRARGAAALCRDVLGPLPGEGRWAYALLVDGNIGIGGDPVALLRRCAGLLAPGGTVLVELDRPGTGLWRGRARLAYDRPGHPIRSGPAFGWARLGVDAVDAVAAAAGLTVTATRCRDHRWFAELVRP